MNSICPLKVLLTPQNGVCYRKVSAISVPIKRFFYKTMTVIPSVLMNNVRYREVSSIKHVRNREVLLYYVLCGQVPGLVPQYLRCVAQPFVFLFKFKTNEAKIEPVSRLPFVLLRPRTSIYFMHFSLSLRDNKIKPVKCGHL